MYFSLLSAKAFQVNYFVVIFCFYGIVSRFNSEHVLLFVLGLSNAVLLTHRHGSIPFILLLRSLSLAYG
jgi:hypothetical protein